MALRVQHTGWYAMNAVCHDLEAAFDFWQHIQEMCIYFLGEIFSDSKKIVLGTKRYKARCFLS